jgi:hypothetical protein
MPDADEEREEERVPVTIRNLDGTTEQHWTTIRERKPVERIVRVKSVRSDGLR